MSLPTFYVLCFLATPVTTVFAGVFFTKLSSCYVSLVSLGMVFVVWVAAHASVAFLYLYGNSHFGIDMWPMALIHIVCSILFTGYLAAVAMA